MSWSKGAKGTATDVIDVAANWIRELDEYAQTLSYVTDDLRSGLRRQSNAALGAITEFLAELPADRQLAVTAAGHANTDGSGEVMVTIRERAAVATDQPPHTQGDGSGEPPPRSPEVAGTAS